MNAALHTLGFDASWEAVAREAGVLDAPLARVVSEQRGLFLVHDGVSDAWASMAGRLRHGIDARTEARPAVGDFVVLRTEADPEHPNQRVIEHVLPRRSCIVRKAAGKATVEQIVAANVDTAFIVCGLTRLHDREVNERRLERLLALAYGGGATPVIILNKIDAVDDPAPYIERATNAAPGVPVHPVSAKSGAGLETLTPYLGEGRTVVLVGSSGAGKSTLANRWLGVELLATAEVAEDGRGRHTSRARQLFRAPSGVLVIDTPGVREAGLWIDEASQGSGVERTFEEITALTGQCKFSDCSHEKEPGCAVRAALEAGKIEPGRFEAFRTLQREEAFVARQADRGQAQRHRAQQRTQSKALHQKLQLKGRK